MGRGDPTDVRQRVAVSVWGGRSGRATAALFRMSVATVIRRAQRRRLTVSAATTPQGHRFPRSLAAEWGWLLAGLAARPDVTSRGLVPEPISAAWRRAVARCGCSFARPGSRSGEDADRARAGPAGDRPASGTVAKVRSASTPGAACSWTRPGPRPTWRGRWSTRRPTATGARLPSWPHSAQTGSMRRSCSTGQSKARASPSGSAGCCCHPLARSRRRGPIRQHRAGLCASSSAPSAAGLCSCRSARPN